MGKRPTIDGQIQPDEWPNAARGIGFFDDDTGQPSTHQGEFWLTYDQEFVYFAARLVGDRRRIVADEFRQNVSLSGNDSVTLTLDLFGNQNQFDRFSLNGGGGTSLSLSGGRAVKTEWLGQFDGNGRLTDNGWECEARIPWSLLTLPPPGRRDLRFNVEWRQTESGRSFEWKYTRDNVANYPVWKDVAIPAVRKAPRLQGLPYFYTGVDEKEALIADAGLDMKALIGSKVNAVAMINPDFRNIEKGILSLDFSYFERLVGEARPFFQEGSGYRNTGFDQRLFASQRINEIDAGVNLYGSLEDKTTFGALSVADFGERAAHVLAVNRTFSPKHSANLAVVIHDKPGQANRAAQLNYSHRASDSLRFFINNQFTDDQVRKSGSRSTLGFNVETPGWSFGADYLQVTPNFFPRIGFSPEQDLRGSSAYVFREVTPKRGLWRSAYIGANVDYFERFDSTPYRRSANFYGGATQRSQLYYGFASLWENFSGSADRSQAVFVGWPSSNPYRNWNLSYTNAVFQGYAFDSISLGTSYRPKKRIQLSLFAQAVRYRGFGRQVIIGVNHDLNRYESIGGRLVYNADDINWYCSYRFGGRVGTEYFLILGDPNAETFRKQVVLKAVVPVQMKF